MVYRSFRRRLLTFWLGCLATVTTIMAIEMGMQNNARGRPRKNFNIESVDSELEHEPKPDLPPRSWPIPQLPPNAIRIPFKWAPTISVIGTPYMFLDPIVGYRPNPFADSRVTLFDDLKVPIYSVRYSFDGLGRRNIGPVNPNRAAALFLGCSVTLGEGIEGDQTFAAEFGRIQHRYQPYVYAFHGWGPANLLSLVRTPDFGKDIATEKGKSGLVVFTYIDHHIARTVGSTSLVQKNRDWLQSMPNYELTPTGLTRNENFGTARSELVEFYYWYQRLRNASRLAGAILTPLPAISAHDFDTVAAVLEELKREIFRKTGILRFRVLIFPGSSTARWIVPRLKARQISVLDYSNLSLRDYVREPQIRSDGHPTSESHTIVGKLLVQDLAR